MLGQGLIQAVPTLLANLPQILEAISSVFTAFNWLELGGNIIKILGNGVQSMGGALTSSFASVMQDGISYIKSLPAKFVGWGKDMIQGLIHGITSMIGDVGSAIGGVASKIASFIHFSRPDVGPLRQYEKWMPDFMAGLSRGITDNLWMVEAAAALLSGATAEPMQVALAGTLRSNRAVTATDAWQPGGMNVNLHNEFYTHDSLSESELTREMEAIIEKSKWDIP